MGMDTWIWLILCIVFIVAEAATTALISVWFAVGAAAALVASIFTNSPVVQFVVFALVSAVTLAVMVPTLVKRRASKKPPVTNGSQLTVGKRGVVLKAIVPGSIGRVRVDGLDWQATADSPPAGRCPLPGHRRRGRRADRGRRGTRQSLTPRPAGGVGRYPPQTKTAPELPGAASYQ